MRDLSVRAGLELLLIGLVMLVLALAGASPASAHRCLLTFRRPARSQHKLYRLHPMRQCSRAGFTREP